LPKYQHERKKVNTNGIKITQNSDKFLHQTKIKKMRQTLLQFFAITFIAIASSFSVKAQTIADFENLSLSPNSFWNGSEQPLGTTFTSGNTIYPCFYDTSFGGFWESGWAYSNILDSTMSGFANLYASKAYGGYNGSANYATGEQDAVIRLTGDAAGKVRSTRYVWA